MLTLIVLIEIILIQEEFKTLIVSFVILGAGLASRFVMGFSPTVFVSGYRTCEVLAFCIIAILCMCYSKSLEYGIITKKEENCVSFILGIMLIFNLSNLFFLVAYSF